MGVPGWPEFACCTASIARVRMVLTHSSSILFFIVADILSSLSPSVPIVPAVPKVPIVKPLKTFKPLPLTFSATRERIKQGV